MSGPMTAEALVALALARGFDAAGLTDALPTEAVPGGAHPQALRLCSDPAEIMPGARSVLVVARGYRPYRPEPGEGTVDAYYVSGNRAHEMALSLADELNGLGVRARLTGALRSKVLAIRAGLGRLGRNALVAVGRFGTRVSIQTIVTDVPCAPSPDPGRELDARCASCALCVERCPAGALRGDGSLDIARCVRAQNESATLPEGMRPMTGGSILGCDMCQRCCPRNAAVPMDQMPTPLRDALDLRHILEGDYRSLRDWLGANNARRMRLTSRAALAAANERRADLIDALRPLCGEPPPVGDHARWALERLEALDKQDDGPGAGQT